MSEPIGQPCHYMRERESHRLCYFTGSECPFDNEHKIQFCNMYQAIRHNHKALNIEDRGKE